MNQYFIDANYKAPEFLGQAADLDIIVKTGTRYVEVAGELKEVSTPIAMQVHKLIYTLRS